MTDKQLYKLCKKYGTRAIVWRQKFVALLPEVYRRRLYEKKKFSSIFEFAARLGGVSNEQVRRVLNLEKRYQPYPILHTMLTSGQVSVNKLARVASIITPENEEGLAHQVKVLSSRTLEVFVRDEKNAQKELQNGLEHENEMLDGLDKPKNDEESVHVHKLKTKAKNASVRFDDGASARASTRDSANAILHFSEEVQSQLLELQNKGIDINALILEMLQKREQEIAEEKEKIAAELEEKEKKINLGSNRKFVSRYIPSKVRKILQKEYGTRCTARTCKSDSEHIHHTQRFAAFKNHNPYFLAPLCKEHHDIAHSMDVKWGEVRGAVLNCYPRDG
ncbi:hypothetical protein COV82_05760 [Candidatus Peregrinibacteria bacterium CG11_big_fil_rev_8_21_14_0_20_46_8]|nr:MAG: hypothetical protein COV82_05760 [Candidatus Peregrinibacteria bacterium CG11_big_fil_rev_8_21_14_0_20_46_8]